MYEMPGRYAPGFCERPQETEEQSVLVKVGLKPASTEPCGLKLVRMGGVLVCPVHTNIVTGFDLANNRPVRQPLGEVFVNRAARRAAA
jgi:hypothetical protein